MPTPFGDKKRAGGKCKAPAMKNGNCRVHAGARTGAPKGNQSAAFMAALCAPMNLDSLASSWPRSGASNRNL
jgi:hypothetical protein